jgi:hypothetical protein
MKIPPRPADMPRNATPAEQIFFAAREATVELVLDKGQEVGGVPIAWIHEWAHAIGLPHAAFEQVIAEITLTHRVVEFEGKLYPPTQKGGN